MNRENDDPLARAVAALSFRALDLNKVSAVMREGLRQDPVPESGVSIQGKHAVSQVRRLEANIGFDKSTTFFIAIYRCNVGLRVVERTQDGAGTTSGGGELLHIEASFDVEYEEKARQGDEALNAFGQKNVACRGGATLEHEPQRLLSRQRVRGELPPFDEGGGDSRRAHYYKGGTKEKGVRVQ